MYISWQMHHTLRGIYFKVSVVTSQFFRFKPDALIKYYVEYDYEFSRIFSLFYVNVMRVSSLLHTRVIFF
jgi:hypothetical protein